MMGCLLSSGERESRGSGRRQEERVTLPRGLHGSLTHKRTHTNVLSLFLSSLLCLTHCGIPCILLSSFMRNKLILLAHLTNCFQPLLHTAGIQPMQQLSGFRDFTATSKAHKQVFNMEGFESTQRLNSVTCYKLSPSTAV